MRNIVYLVSLFTISAFIFSATVNAANNLAENYLPSAEERESIEELMLK